MKVMTNPKSCCAGLSCRKDLVLVEEVDKNDKPIKDLVLSINGDLFSKSMQITVLSGQKDKHKRSINLPASCEHRHNMTIKHIMNNVITW